MSLRVIPNCEKVTRIVKFPSGYLVTGQVSQEQVACRSPREVMDVLAGVLDLADEDVPHQWSEIPGATPCDSGSMCMLMLVTNGWVGTQHVNMPGLQGSVMTTQDVLFTGLVALRFVAAWMGLQSGEVSVADVPDAGTAT